MDRRAGQGKTITSMILREELQRYLFFKLAPTFWWEREREREREREVY